MLIVAQGAYAQRTINVSGTVTDPMGQPVIGAGVMIPGTPIGEITDADGKYSLKDVPENASLTIAAIGYVTQVVPVNGQKVIDVVLAEDILALDDAVVIGYGTQRKGDITSAVASVKSEEFLIGNIHDASELIRGKVAGLSITKSSGDPNAGSTIRLRGVTTINGDLTPLILVDGVPGDMGTVAPENIADITVLKDASAAAIIACGLLKMWKLDGATLDNPALPMATRILCTLASPEYLAEPRTNGGFLLKHSVGNIPGNSEVDVPLTYADYYFLEALTLLPQ